MGTPTRGFGCRPLVGSACACTCRLITGGASRGCPLLARLRFSSHSPPQAKVHCVEFTSSFECNYKITSWLPFLGSKAQKSRRAEIIAPSPTSPHEHLGSSYF